MERRSAVFCGLLSLGLWFGAGQWVGLACYIDSGGVLQMGWFSLVPSCTSVRLETLHQPQITWKVHVTIVDVETL